MIHAWPLVFGVSMTRGPRSWNFFGRFSTQRFGGSLMCPSAEIARYCIPILRVHVQRIPHLDDDGSSPEVSFECHFIEGARNGQAERHRRYGCEALSSSRLSRS